MAICLLAPGLGTPAASQPSPEPLLAVVSIASQRVTLHAGTRTLARSSVSTGKSGHATPPGVFSIIQKNRWHTSNIYSNAPMPFMQRITWSGIALHEGHLPGYPASHGCIRLPRDFAAYLWGQTRLGNRVVVAPRDTSPEPFEHAWLPRATMTPATPAGGPLSLASSPASAITQGALDPIAYARVLRAMATAAQRTAEQAALEALNEAGLRAAAAQRAVTALRDAAEAVAEAEQRLQAARERLASATDDRRVDAESELADAADHLDEARRIIAELTAEEAVATPAAFAAAARVRAAEAAIDATKDTLADARRREQPLSVFISRKERRLFVRQGFQPLFDAAIEISEPDRPLGTHLLMATGHAGAGDLEWLSITVPETRGPAGGTPAEALDRITLPADVRSKLADRLWVGGAIIVSDHGLGETGQGTDFVILTK